MTQLIEREIVAQNYPNTVVQEQVILDCDNAFISCPLLRTFLVDTFTSY